MLENRPGIIGTMLLPRSFFALGLLFSVACGGPEDLEPVRIRSLDVARPYHLRTEVVNASESDVVAMRATVTCTGTFGDRVRDVDNELAPEAVWQGAIAPHSRSEVEWRAVFIGCVDAQVIVHDVRLANGVVWHGAIASPRGQALGLAP